MPRVLYSAAVVCPMNGPPFADGGVVVEGDRIVAMGAERDLARDADRTHRWDGVLLPGLVNASTQLEHSDAAGLAVPGPHHAWVRALEGRTRGWTDDAWTRSARRGVQQALHAGTVAAGDVVTRGPAVPAASRAGLRGDSWVEVRGVDVRHADAVLGQVRSALGLPAEGRRVGIAPAATYANSTGVLQALADLAARAGRPLHLPAAQTQAEVAAVRSGEGPLADQARERGLQFEWLEGGTGLSPIRYLDACGALTPRTTVAGGVYVDVLEARLLAERGVTVVCTPRANTLLHAGEAPLERYAQAGTRLALGTGSPAGAPDLDLLAEAAAWVELARARGVAFWPSAMGPLALEEQALRLATVDGAAAMGWAGETGVLEVGRRADLAVVQLETTAATVYRDLVRQGAGRQVLTVVGGVGKARRLDAAAPWPPIDRHEQAD